MKRRCPHLDCLRSFWSGARLLEHLQRAHRYSWAESINKVYPGAYDGLPDVYAEVKP